MWPFGPPNNLRGGFPGPSGPQPILGLFFLALRAPKQSWGGVPGPSGPRPILGLFFRALRAPKQSQGRVSGPFGFPHNLRVLGLGFRGFRTQALPDNPERPDARPGDRCPARGPCPRRCWFSAPVGPSNNLRVGFPDPSSPQAISWVVFQARLARQALKQS